jgi:nitrous oxidase accessory protein
VAPGAALQPLLDSGAPGTAWCLEPGGYAGPVRVPAGATLWGPRDAVIRSSGAGTTVRLDGAGAALLGLTVDGSGGRFDLLDAAVHVHGDGARVEGVHVRNALFGILVEQVRGVLLRDDEVEGDPGKPLGLRGDGIRLWETRDSRVEGNRIRHSRDLVVWYSPGNRFRSNVVEDGRYGTHFMYSHRNVLEDNVYRGNVVAIFAMYSRELVLRHNVLAESGGAAGVGLGCKESGGLRVTDNAFVGNTIGLYLDTCPLYEDESNRFEDNLFQFADAAVVLHGSEQRNTFAGNAFESNDTPLRIEGRSRGGGVTWIGNHFDDYAGYDLDGDGFGDVPYELRSLEGDLTRRDPGLAFFRGSLAMGMVEAVGRMIPLFQPRLLLVDPRPRMSAEGIRAD